MPVGAEGWDIAAGTTPLDALLAGVPRGALVDRLSMGRPAANGDFSGVIKNSFAIRDGEVGHALSETMISGNVAQMLRDVERRQRGAHRRRRLGPALAAGGGPALLVTPGAAPRSARRRRAAVVMPRDRESNFQISDAHVPGSPESHQRGGML